MKYEENASRKTRWKDLLPQHKAHIAAAALMASRRHAYALNVDLGLGRIAKAHADSRGFVDHVFRTMQRALKRNLGRVPSFWIVVEDIDKTGKVKVAPHVHGIISIDPDEHSALIHALLYVADDYYAARAVKLEPLWNAEGWASYCFKNLHKGNPLCTGFKMTDFLRLRARKLYSDGLWPALRKKDRVADPAPGSSAGSRNVQHVLAVAPNASKELTPFQATAQPDQDYIPSSRFQEQVRLANISIFARLLSSAESAVRRRADEIATQIDAQGDRNDPGVPEMRREASVRADRILDERVALVSGRRSWVEVDLAMLFPRDRAVSDTSSGGLLASAETPPGSL